MNDQQRAAMQMALEDLTAVWPDSRASITALREALAQPQEMKECRHCGWLCKPNDAPSKKGYVLAQDPSEQAPVAWHEPGSYGNVTTHKDWALANGWEPLYKEKNT